ncbi:hypothetical protein FIV42_05870 [Persicimonas caeni]|uniref:Outer membrane lipoprotein-sorting protein n=1 Tax=Persicimonas caeni TaxID=2292766 RepID=A0A4Y6PPN6_PERCE|nr:hypothetical protein [Persicimonas caeni]QDG50274.1 hypothetical protein FIV42_05870 [Persicimonas caeni]QED31495.1 hypothetical protein FRD00_05865 [Persicimonas caeni]
MRRLTHKTWLLALAGMLAASACADPLPEDPASYEPYRPGELEPLDCVPNLDGQIDSAEMAARVGVPVRYLVSPDGEHRPVDLSGRPRGDQFVWDWSEDMPSDQLAVIEASELSEMWYADKFPGGQFVAPSDLGGRIEAVYSRTDNALRLHGLASVEQDPPEGQTLMVYNSPVELYRFPLEPGRDWVSTGIVENSKVRGLPYAGRDIYEVKVDAMGELALPSFTFEQVHKVHTKVTLQPAAGESQTTRQVSFLFECFGEVARATSQEGETDEDFGTAAEVRRLGFE